MNSAILNPSKADAEPLHETFYPSGGRSARNVPREASQRPAPAALPPGANELDGTVPLRTTNSQGPGRWSFLLFGSLVALIGAAWQVSHMGLFKSSDDTSYWIAVTGGSMMLMLFTYPLRKYVRFMQGLGKVKWWFWFHLLMGIGGPWLILVHSGFRSESMNAGVALYSMLTVVFSGVIGLFIYVRVHRGLDGERTSLRELRKRAGFVESNARSRLHFAPHVEERLLGFEQNELRPGWATHLRQVTLLPVQQWITYVRCVVELRQPLQELGAKYHWSQNELRRRKRRARRLVDQYLNAVVRVAQYTAFERLFALWHMAHLPFVYLLIISAVVHVIAVHAY
jgi:hypothetical protein